MLFMVLSLVCVSVAEEMGGPCEWVRQKSVQNLQLHHCLKAMIPIIRSNSDCLVCRVVLSLYVVVVCRSTRAGNASGRVPGGPVFFR